jgi:dihydrofolate synthase/folylpolyglutamate synthase
MNTTTTISYQETLDYMYAQLPMFHRIGSAAYKADMDNTIALCARLGNPEKKFRSIHVAGTNGKGSTSHLLAAILQAAGLKVGLYTSPHLKDFRERIKINGAFISQAYVTEFVSKHKNYFEKLQPSFFEMTVGLAFDYFATQEVDIAVIEVGLGGRLDSTNIITPEVAVITNISFDHMALLGNTLEKIAGEKAGIIKSHIPIIIGETQTGSAPVFIEKANTLQAPLIFADQQYKAVHAGQQQDGERVFLNMDIEQDGKIIYRNLQSELLGLYQLKNIPTVLATVDELNKKGFQLTEAIIRKGIQQVISTTGLLGRWQVLAYNPLIIADTGHNEAGIKEVLAQLQVTPHERLHMIIGMVNDKDISSVLSLLPKDAICYFCKAAIPRALPAKELQAAAQLSGLSGTVHDTVAAALQAAKNKATRGDLILVGGSTFTVAEVV